MRSELEAIIQDDFLPSGHGVILFGSAYQYYYGSAQSSPKPRDIDIVIVTDRPALERESIEKRGLIFDVHRYSYEKVMGLVHQKKNMLWIRNFFAAQYFCPPDSILVMFRKMIEQIRQNGPGNFLPPRNREDDRLIAKNYRGKLKVHNEDILTAAAYFQHLVQLNYAWLCRDKGLWPSADPRAISRDIRDRMPGFHQLIEDYLWNKNLMERLDCIDKIDFF